MGIPQAASQTAPLVAIGISPSVRRARPSMRSLRRNGRGFRSTVGTRGCGSPSRSCGRSGTGDGLTGENRQGPESQTVRKESRARARRGPTTVEPHSMASAHAIVTIDGWPPNRSGSGLEHRTRARFRMTCSSERTPLPPNYCSVVNAITSHRAPRASSWWRPSHKPRRSPTFHPIATSGRFPGAPFRSQRTRSCRLRRSHEAAQSGVV